jgi:hypothetical protein
VSERKHIAQDATALAALPETSLERRAAEAHARVCSDCARALREGARLLEAVDQKLELEPPSAESLGRAKLGVRRRAAVQLAIPAAGIPLLFAAAIAFLGRSRGDPVRWTAAATLAGLATALCWRAAYGRVVRWTLLAATCASIAFAAAFGARADLAAVLGIRCALIEVVPALTAFAIAAALTHTSAALLRDRWRAVALVATGGLTMQAALLVSCPAKAGAMHVLLFHSGGLLAVCALFAVLAPLLGPKAPPGLLG